VFFVGFGVGIYARGVGFIDTNVEDVGFCVPVVSFVGLSVG